MADNVTQFARELAKALTRSGISLLTQPDRLLAVLSEAVQDDPAMSTLKQNCTTRLLDPFYDLVSRNQDPPDSELKEAARDAETYLVQERFIEQPAANLLCMQIAEGISLYLHPNVESVSASGNDSGSTSDASTDSKTGVTLPDLRPWQKRLPLIVAALALAAAGIVLSMRITISFDGNGSTGGSMSPARVWKDKEWTVPSCRFSRQGFAFMGWALDGKTYQPRDTLIISHDCTLRAQWGATISFQANGGSGSMRDLPADELGFLELPACDYYRSDYEFVGWSTKESSWSDNPEVLDPGAGIVVDGPATYYAIWAPLASFNPNGASGSMDEIRITPSGKVTLPKNEFTRSGYRFVGWSKSKDGKLAAPGRTVTADGPTTFYAVWRPLASFDSNGGSGTMSDIAAKKGGVLTLPKNGFTRSGYRFDGWATSKNGSPKSAGDTTTISSPTTFYAIWRAGVTFDGNGADSGSTATVYANGSDIATLPQCGFSRAGYTFLGWGDKADSTSYWNPGDHVAASSPRTLYALWRIRPDIGDEIAHSSVFKDWETGGSSLFVYFTNNAPITVKLDVDFSYLDGSKNQIDETSDTVTTLAPGETTLLVGASDKSGIQRINYTFYVSAPDEGHPPIRGNYSVTETTCERGRLVLRVSNTSDKAIVVRRVIGYGSNSTGGESWFSRYFNTHLNPGESLQVTCDSSGYDWPSHTRAYYIDGYAS